MLNYTGHEPDFVQFQKHAGFVSGLSERLKFGEGEDFLEEIIYLALSAKYYSGGQDVFRHGILRWLECVGNGT